MAMCSKIVKQAGLGLAASDRSARKIRDTSHPKIRNVGKGRFEAKEGRQSFQMDLKFLPYTKSAWYPPESPAKGKMHHIANSLWMR